MVVQHLIGVSTNADLSVSGEPGLLSSSACVAEVRKQTPFVQPHSLPHSPSFGVDFTLSVMSNNVDEKQVCYRTSRMIGLTKACLAVSSARSSKVESAYYFGYAGFTSQVIYTTGEVPSFKILETDLK